MMVDIAAYIGQFVYQHDPSNRRPYRELTCVRLLLPQGRQVRPCFFENTMQMTILG